MQFICSLENSEKLQEHHKQCKGLCSCKVSIDRDPICTYSLHTTSNNSSESDLSLCLDSENVIARINEAAFEKNKLQSRTTFISHETHTVDMKLCHVDELPVFDIRSVSPFGRSPSPIGILIPEDLENDILQDMDTSSNRVFGEEPEFLSLQEINEQIFSITTTEPSELCKSNGCHLETIFEGVFLNTPPRKKNRTRTHF